MTERPVQNIESTEADGVGEKPDLGRTRDALIEALSGTGAGSDTRSGSLQGGSATGSDDDPDQRSVDRTMAREARAKADADPAEGKTDGPTG